VHSVWLSILGYSALGCIGMAVQDTVGVTLVKAIGTGRAFLAGCCDAAGDVAKIAIMSISGVELTSNFGWRGFLGVIPILCTGFLVTYHATKATSGIVDEAEVAADKVQDTRLQALEAKVEAILRSTGKS